MFEFAEQLWGYHRSLTGEGVRRTLHDISKRLPDLQILGIPSGSRVGDWTVPQEWLVESARLIGPDGNTVCDSELNNLHILGYSDSFTGVVSLEELQQHLYSLPDLPTAIPYVTSYYERRWGFCISQQLRQSLKPGNYRVDIRTRFVDGLLNYGELIIPGETQDEVFISTYICHPSLANNELSGPVVATELADAVSKRKSRHYTYRFVFAPETIGAIAYLAVNASHLKANVKAAFNLTCVGDDRAYSFLPTRNGKRGIDAVARHVLQHHAPSFIEYPWTERGSDERQYGSPPLDLPMISLMRSKYWCYPEYHTSLDQLGTVVTASGLRGGFDINLAAIEILEENRVPITRTIGEPMLGKRGLYSTLGAGNFSIGPTFLLDVWSLCDGKTSILDIAERLEVAFHQVNSAVNTLVQHELVEFCGFEVCE